MNKKNIKINRKKNKIEKKKVFCWVKEKSKVLILDFFYIFLIFN